MLALLTSSKSPSASARAADFRPLLLGAAGIALDLSDPELRAALEGAIAARPEENGRFFYKADLTGLNFIQGRGRLEDFLRDLLIAKGSDRPPAMAVQSEILPEVLPAFADANRLALALGIAPRIWIGNRIRVAPHYDIKENIGCCVAGRRRFTVFPPAQLANMYPGPFELTPAGTPVSMVDPHAPDLARYPRYREAWAAALALIAGSSAG